MKTRILRWTLTGIVAVFASAAFGQESEKATEARKNVAKANLELREAKLDSASDYKKFKEDAELKIAENQKKIESLKEKKQADNKITKDDYDKKVMALEEKNTALKLKVKEADNTKTSRWTSFKKEFNRDLDEIGQAFKDLTVDNKN